MKDPRTPRLGRELDESELGAVSGGLFAPDGDINPNDVPWALRIRARPGDLVLRADRLKNAGRLAGGGLQP